MCLASKTVYHKSYKDLQLMTILIYHWKKSFIDFMIDLLLSTNWKSNSYDLFLIIINCLIKIVHYKSVKVTINALKFAKVLINIVLQYHSLLNSIISDWRAIFMFKFWSSLYFFFGIKRQISTKFYLLTDGQIE